MAASTKEKKTAPVDLLGRQGIVDNIIKILETIHKKHSHCTFALNGGWGVGKSFVLDMLINQLWENHSDKYIVFHYNCWQYDYYEEPLVAIVAAMLDSLDENNHLLSDEIRTEIKAGIMTAFGKAKIVVQEVMIEFIKKNTGIDMTEILSVMEEYQEEVDKLKKAKEDERTFDEFYSFKKAIKTVQEEIEKLSRDRTVVVVVDELDRCLPSYAIKVLERLHHLFTGVENSAVFLAVDKAQLDKTVSGIFGEGSTDKYLRKFVNYELELDRGEIVGGFWEKYTDYCTLFDPSMIDTPFDFEQFIKSLFSDMDIRDQELLMNKVKTAHLILFPDEKKDYSFMCAELMYSVLTTSKSYGFFPITRKVQSSITLGTISLSYSYDSPEDDKLNSYFDKFWSFETPLLYSRQFQEYVDPDKCKFELYQNKAIPGGSAIIQELLHHYWSNMNSNRTEFFSDFIFVPAPVGYADLKSLDLYTLKQSIMSFAEFFGQDPIRTVIIKKLIDHSDYQAYIENLFVETAKKWLEAYANKNLNDLIAFKEMFDLLH